MSFKLWNNIKVWQKVLLNRWEKVLGVTENWIITKSWITNFWDQINWWKFN